MCIIVKGVLYQYFGLVSCDVWMLIECGVLNTFFEMGMLSLSNMVFFSLVFWRTKMEYIAYILVIIYVYIYIYIYIY